MTDPDKIERPKFSEWAERNGFDVNWLPLVSQFDDRDTQSAWIGWCACAAASVAAQEPIKLTDCRHCGFRVALNEAPQDAQPAQARIAELEAENAALLLANRDCTDHFQALKADYDALLAAPVAAQGEQCQYPNCGCNTRALCALNYGPVERKPTAY